MKRFLLVLMMLGFLTTPGATSSLGHNDQLYDEFHTSLRKLEHMFMVYDDLSDLNPSSMLNSKSPASWLL